MNEKKASDAKKEGSDEKESSMNVWDCGSPLYDSYELASLSHVLDRHMMVLPSLMLSGSRLRAPPLPPASTQFISVASNNCLISSSIIGAATTTTTNAASKIKVTLSSVVYGFLNKFSRKTSGKSMITGTGTGSGGRARRLRSKLCNQKIVDHI